MTEIELNKEWSRLEEEWKERFGKVPNMEAVLFMIGINEYQGRNPKYKFAKNEKEDLMHVATCTLLSDYYELEHYDDEGWPHFKQIKEIDADDLVSQETLLKYSVIQYFKKMYQ